MLVSNKKALSNVVAYALLITMTIALSTIVFAWLRLYVGDTDVPECPSGVDVVIKNYSCVPYGNLDLTIRNMGRFSIESYRVRVDHKQEASSGFYLARNITGSSEGRPLSPGQEVFESYSLSLICDGECIEGKVTIAEVQPFYKKGSKVVSCRSQTTQKIVC